MAKLSRLALCALAAVATLPAFGGLKKGPPPQLYTMERVDPPEGYRGLVVHAVDQRGEIAGLLTNDWVPHKTVFFREADGTMKRIEGPPGCLKTQVQWVVAFNDRHDLIVHAYACGPDWFWSPGGGWVKIALGAEYTNTTPRGMNGAGDVVGTTYTLLDGQMVPEGFVWHGDGTATTYRIDGGVGFYGINDKGEIAATITHIADPNDPDDRDGVSAALLRDGQEPAYTGNFFVRNRQEYEHGPYSVYSTAVAINQEGGIALDSPAELEGHHLPSTVCAWHLDEKLRCAIRPMRRLRGVGIDGDGNAIYSTGGAWSYVMFANGVSYSLGEVTSPPQGEWDFDAWGVNDAGLIVGQFRHENVGFVLRPIRQD
jgi:hypothetical protein